MVGVLTLSGGLFYELKYHATTWNAQALYRGASYHWQFDRVYLGNHYDPPYITILIVSLVLTVLTGVFLAVMARRERTEKRKIQQHWQPPDHRRMIVYLAAHLDRPMNT